VSVRLNLPEGVTATGTGTAPTVPDASGEDGEADVPLRLGTGGLSWATADGVLAQAGVTCTGGTGTIRCATTSGVPPRGRAQFTFTLRAAIDAVDGVVTGTVSGGVVDLALAAIDVVVRPAPDVLDLRASAQREEPWRTRLAVQATNTGRTTRPVAVTVALPDGVFLAVPAAGCAGSAGTVTCTSVPLGPGQLAGWQLVLGANSPVTANATVTGVLGSARQAVTVPLDLDIPCRWPPGKPPLCPPGHVPDKPFGITLWLFGQPVIELRAPGR
jgi:hypothetical protein